MLIHRHCDYLGNVFGGANRFDHTVKKACRLLRSIDKKTPFAYIAASGVSGITVGSAIAYVLKKNLIVVRKPVEMEKEDRDWEECDRLGYSHSNMSVEGYPLNVSFNYIIVDDLICSGNTMRRISDSILAKNHRAIRVGYYLYIGHTFNYA
jgi:adenine/guanine phosphoribosyltransferase-like PRPP-binding protein